jgi:hypothetical protein
VPVVWKANENCPPGATMPEFQPAPFDVEVCEVESVFIQVTVVPTATVKSSGLKAVFVNKAAPAGIDTDADVPAGAGAGDGVGAGGGDGVGAVDAEPQARANIRRLETTARRSEYIGPSE